jgi:regulator of sigma E protease
MLHIVTNWIYPIFLVVFFFGLTIFIHEFGHFIVAKKRGLKVERFSIGFGPPIWKWTRNGIEYRISWLPFGGYVMLPQMAPMEAVEGKSKTKTEEIPPASPATKVLVSLAGPALNLALAFVLATMVYFFGLPTPVNPNIVGWVEPGSREEQLGIREGDRVVQINDEKVHNWDEIKTAVALSEGNSVRAVIQRGTERQEHLLETEVLPGMGFKVINLFSQGRPFARRVRPGSPAERAGLRAGDKFLAVENAAVSTQRELREMVGKRANLPTRVKLMRSGKIRVITVVPELDPRENAGRMGVELDDEVDFEIIHPGPTPWAQFDDALTQMGRSLNAMLHYRQTKIGIDSMNGPIGISIGWWSQIVRGGVLRGLWFAVIINIALAVFNLLPLPVLDGGHILFSAIESAIRRPLNPRFVHVSQTAFAALLISFMLYVSFNDLRRFIPWPNKVAPRPVAVPETNAPPVP